MPRNTVSILGVLLLIAITIFYLQFRVYRTSAVLEETGESVIEIVTANPDPEAIPSILEPDFESVMAADVYLNDSGYGIAVEVGGRVRFYPYQLIVWHQAVNDVFGEKNLLVTYDPLCNSGLVYEREISGEVATFGVSGKVWNNNTLLFDHTTNSLWSQLNGKSLEGAYTNTSLSRYPSQIMTWSAFKTDYSYGEVLSRDTGYSRDYTQNPYEQEGYEESPAIWYALSHEDARLSPKSLIFGLERNEDAVAFPVDSWSEFDTINEQMDDGDVLQPSFWFCWAAIHPGTEIYSLNE